MLPVFDEDDTVVFLVQNAKCRVQNVGSATRFNSFKGALIYICEYAIIFGAVKGMEKKHIDARFTDEAVKSEREARAEIRNATKDCIAKAKSQNIDVKVNFFYVTASGKELTSRPDEGYRYTVCAEISHIGETDEDRIVVTDEDLLYVRFTKTGYKCNKNKNFSESFIKTIEEVVDTIGEKGIDFYCE